MTTADRQAVTESELHPLLAGRWSPRGFDTAHELSDAELAALLEAARWAPSCANRQPWRFVVGRRGEPTFDRIAAHLAEGNLRWAPRASLLLLAASVNEAPDGATWLPWSHYDTGQAIAHLTVQASALDLAVHQMGGFDIPGMAAEFGLPETVEPLAVVAVGRWDPQADLPDDLKAREFAPRTRHDLADLLIFG
ncbi:MAG: nitroreductase family protein [Sporichthyaceae bacterium]